MAESRTSKSIKNSIIALVFYFMNLVLSFISRKVFLEYLGTEVLGLNTTAMNLLQFLNLAELGVSTAVGFTLYKPIHDDDKQTINEIVTLQGQLYRRIAWIIILGSLILMCFFPWIFKKMDLPLWYAYASFGVLLFSALLGYFVNYRQIVLSASQQDYKVLYSFRSVMLLKVCFQMFAVWKMPQGYIWWLILEAVFAILGSWTLHRMTVKSFPFLKDCNDSYFALRSKYQEFTTKIKQIFFHKIGLFTLTQSSPLIIYAFASLNVVTLYGNYILITNGIQNMMNSVFNSMGAGIGNLVAEGDRNRIIAVFDELYSIRFLISATLCYCTFVLTPPFISLWIGSQYLLPSSTLLLIVILLFISLNRVTVDNFINAYGLFSDIWAPVAEAILNIGGSIVLGYFYGLNGIIIGVILSQIIVIILWKPYFLFTKGIPGYLPRYWRIFIWHILSAVIAAIGSIYVKAHIHLSIQSQTADFVFSACINILLYSIILFGILYISFSGMKAFTKRVIHKC